MASHAAPNPSPTVLLEDEHVLVLDKPPGWLVSGDGTRCILNWARDRDIAAGYPADAIRLVHRLDRDTSGVLVLGRGEEAARRLGAAFSERRVFKLYIALTNPVPAVRWARVEHALRGRREGKAERMEVVAEGGQLATSEVEVLARSRRFGLVRVLPEQGRKHQVRVALAELGAPIAGDFLYGGARTARIAPRVMLHAYALDLAHPFDEGRHLRLRATLPADMVELFREDGGIAPLELDRRHKATPVAAPSRARPAASRPSTPKMPSLPPRAGGGRPRRSGGAGKAPKR